MGHNTKNVASTIVAVPIRPLPPLKNTAMAETGPWGGTWGILQACVSEMLKATFWASLTGLCVVVVQCSAESLGFPCRLSLWFPLWPGAFGHWFCALALREARGVRAATSWETACDSSAVPYAISLQCPAAPLSFRNVFFNDWSMLGPSRCLRSVAPRTASVCGTQNPGARLRVAWLPGCRFARYHRLHRRTGAP